MAKATCSVCGGGIDTESSPSGKCVRCSERAARKSPLAVTPPKAPPPAPVPAAPEPAADQTLSAGERQRVQESLHALVGDLGAVPAVEHEPPKHEHAKPAHHGKKHGG
jgi:hypothetical protein